MRCIDPSRRGIAASAAARGVRAGAAAALLLLAACETAKPPATPSTSTGASPPITVNRPLQPAPGRLPVPDAVRSLVQLKQQAARRLVAANPEIIYTGAVPETLLAIPVLEIELNADGSVRNIDVLRKPRQALDTTQLAIDAVHRAAPFGDVSRMPKPWKFTETFLFRDDRRFKPRNLDA